MSSGSPDRIELTVATSLVNSSVSNVVKELKAQLLKDLEREMGAARAAETGVLPTVQGRRTLEMEGRKFEITGKAKTIQKEGEDDIQSIQMRMREITEDEAKLNAARLKNARERWNKDIKRIRQELRLEEERREAIARSSLPIEGLETSAVQLRKKLDTEEIRARKEKTTRGKQEIRAREKALEEARAFQASTEVGVEGLEAQAAKLGAKERQIRIDRGKQVYKEFMEREKAIEEEFRQSFVPVEGLEKQAAAKRKEIDTEHFRSFRRHILSGNDPAKQLQEIDKEITKATGVQLEELKIMRQRTVRAIKMQASQTQRERDLLFQNVTLGAASAAIGVLGTAGFPVLNVAFAAMSGGKIGASVAAAATIFGQLVGTVKEFRDEAMQTARSLDLLGKTFKEAEGRMKVLQVFAGGGTTAARIGVEQQTIMMERAIRQDTGQFFQNLSEAFKLTKTQIATNQGDTSSFLKQMRINYEKISELNTPQARLQDALEARRSFILKMSQGMPGIETDPYEVWKRIQTAAMDPVRQEEMNIQKEQLKSMNKVVDELRKIAEREGGFFGRRGGQVAAGDATGIVWDIFSGAGRGFLNRGPAGIFPGALRGAVGF